MKKYLNYSMFFAIFGLVAGVYFREFTKFNGFTGVTSLGKVHTHAFALGMIVYLIVALFADRYDLEAEKTFKRFNQLYPTGLTLVLVMLLVRGTLQVLGTELSKGLSASISGIAGISHILLAGGIIHLLLALKKVAKS